MDPGPGTHTVAITGGDDVFITKHSTNGSLIWAKSFGGPGADWGLQVTTDALGNVYVMGQFSGNGFNGSGVSDFDPGPGTFTMSAVNKTSYFVCKLNPMGNFVWAKILVDQPVAYHRVNYMATDTAGNCFFSGSFSNTADFDTGPGTMTLTSQGSNDFFVLKLDKNGNFGWVKTISEAYASYITLDEYQDIYVTGGFVGTIDIDPGPGTTTLIAVGGTDVFVIKLNASGNLVFGKSLGGAGGDGAQCIQTQPGGGIVISGTFSGTANFYPAIGSFTESSVMGKRQHYVAKLDASGNYLWAKAFELIPQFTGKNITVSSTGAILFVGSYSNTVDFDPGPSSYTLNYTPTNNQKNAPFLLQLNASGQFEWVRELGGLRARSLAFTGNNTAIIIGEFYNSVDFDFSAATHTIASSGHLDVFMINITNTLLIDVSNGIEHDMRDPQNLVYPNPVSHSLRLQWPGNSGQPYILTDVSGKIILQGDTDPHQDIDVSALPTGVYFLHINGRFKSTHKFIKM